MTVKLKSPYPFPERLLLFGGGGAGKTETILNWASHVDGEFHILDADDSAPYERALSTTYADLGAEERVHVDFTEDDWDPFTEQLAETIKRADQKHDVLVLDPHHLGWDMAQEKWISMAYGEDIATHIASLRQQHSDDDDLKTYHAELTEHMNWPVIKKIHRKGLWRQLKNWHGDLVLTAEAKELGKRDNEEVKGFYGPIGYKPAGEGRVMYVCATNLFLDHPSRGRWRMTTVKDRNREEMDKMDVDDFGLDYLVGIAGWERARKTRA